MTKMGADMKWMTLVFLVVLAGCNPGVSGTRPDGTKTDGQFSKAEFEGHDYILYREGFSEYATGGIEHDPECRKCKQ